MASIAGLGLLTPISVRITSENRRRGSDRAGRGPYSPRGHPTGTSSVADAVAGCLPLTLIPPCCRAATPCCQCGPPKAGLAATWGSNRMGGHELPKPCHPQLPPD
jgi:hypothetical protein